MQPRSVPPSEQPAAGALLHLQCELPAELRPVLIRWWEDFHYAELLTLPGFLWARRGHLLSPDGQAPIVTMYGIADPAAADQPRPPEFTLLPSELDGRVSFHRRILQRTSPLTAAAEPVGATFLQLLRPRSEHPGHDPQEAAGRVLRWPGVRSVSCWRSVVNAPHTSRREVVHLGGTDLILAELAAGDRQVVELQSRAAVDLRDWEACAYQQAFPAVGP